MMMHTQPRPQPRANSLSVCSYKPKHRLFVHNLVSLLSKSKSSSPLSAVSFTRSLKRRNFLKNDLNYKIKSYSDHSSSTSDSSLLTSDKDNDEDRKTPELKTLFRRFCKVAAPYWFSDDKVQARLQLAALFALTLASTGISVGYNFLGRDFFNALASKNREQFTKQLIYYLGSFAVGIPIFVLRFYARKTLALRWRSWMTKYYMERYFKDRMSYKIQSLSTIDNPDQRIVDDLSSFTDRALSFSMTLFNAVVDLISFSKIMHGIYPPLFLVLLVYSIGGTAVSVFLGKGLVTLNFLQEKKEADFRYGLVRVRENAESIAFYGGEENEMQLLLQRFKSAFENLTQLLISSRNLEFFTNGYATFIQILPAAVVAPMYFSGKIELGVINQCLSAFNHILSDFSLIVYQFDSISAFSAVVDRLGEFDDVLDSDNSKCLSDPLEEICLMYRSVENSTLSESIGSKLLDVENLTLRTPRSKATLVRDLSFEIIEKDHLLVTGPSGSGKTSLLRAMAGLWTNGRGNITFYEEDEEDFEMKSKITNRSSKGEFLFLPQKPYMVLGSLRQQLLYPKWAEKEISSSSDGNKPTTDDLIQALESVRLGYILSRFNSLDSTQEWSSVLSLGEQQRLAFARLLLSKPKLVLLDESTSALDEANEAHLYQQIDAAGITYISIGHRRTLYDFHKRMLHISPMDPDTSQINWRIESINIDCQALKAQFKIPEATWNEEYCSQSM